MSSARPLVLAALVASGCAAAQGLHPPAPPAGGLGPLPDPPPSLVVVHATIFADAIRLHLDGAIPSQGAGEIPIVAGQRLGYSWERKPLALGFDRGRLVISAAVTGHVRLLGDRVFPIQVTIAGEPVITSDYQARMQSVSVEVRADSPVERLSRAIEDTLRTVVLERLGEFRLDVRPLLAAAYDRIARPLPFRLGEGSDAIQACALLRIAGIEAGPTVLAGDFEKDIALVVLPSVVLPCPAAAPAAPPAPLPLLANVATLASGPFTVTVPIAASYDELGRASERAMGGRLRFSREYPDLYLEKPAVYPSRDSVVIKIVLGGSVRFGGSRIKLAGEIFLSGHPRVIDNQITVPDLELTPGTASGLLKLKVLLDGRAIRDQAQSALRLDLSERIAAARDKLSRELSFDVGGPPPPAPALPGPPAPGSPGPVARGESGGCVRAEALRTEVTGIFPHESFLRIYVVVNAQASLYMPCRR